MDGKTRRERMGGGEESKRCEEGKGSKEVKGRSRKPKGGGGKVEEPQKRKC